MRGLDRFSFRLRFLGPYRFIQNRPGTSIVALKSVTAAEESKDQLSRDFRVNNIPSRADVASRACQVRKVPILLQKSFWGDERNFLEPLMRFTSGDVRDHIVSSKIDQGPP
jgi:hypothetical protein